MYDVYMYLYMKIAMYKSICKKVYTYIYTCAIPTYHTPPTCRNWCMKGALRKWSKDSRVQLPRTTLKSKPPAAPAQDPWAEWEARWSEECPPERVYNRSQKVGT